MRDLKGAMEKVNETLAEVAGLRRRLDDAEMIIGKISLETADLQANNQRLEKLIIERAGGDQELLDAAKAANASGGRIVDLLTGVDQQVPDKSASTAAPSIDPSTDEVPADPQSVAAGGPAQTLPL